MWADYSTDQKNFTGHMFNIKLEEKPYKMSFKALPVKIQRSENRQAGVGTSICCANQLTGFYIRATLAFNGLI